MNLRAQARRPACGEGRRGWVIANAVWVQLGWWGSVLGAQHPWLLLVVVLGLALHLGCYARPGAELRLLLGVALVGGALDATLGACGVFAFDTKPLPLWLLLLWLVFASGLRHSLAWAARPAWRGALLGVCGGPLAYCAGAPLAGVELPLGVLGTTAVLAPLWALGLPLALRLANRT